MKGTWKYERVIWEKRKSLNKNDLDQVFWARETEPPLPPTLPLPSFFPFYFRVRAFFTPKVLLCCAKLQGTQREIWRKRLKNNNKAWIKLPEAILSILGWSANWKRHRKNEVTWHPQVYRLPLTIKNLMLKVSNIFKGPEAVACCKPKSPGATD